MLLLFKSSTVYTATGMLIGARVGLHLVYRELNRTKAAFASTDMIWGAQNIRLLELSFAVSTSFDFWICAEVGHNVLKLDCGAVTVVALRGLDKRCNDSLGHTFRTFSLEGLQIVICRHEMR